MVYTVEHSEWKNLNEFKILLRKNTCFIFIQYILKQFLLKNVTSYMTFINTWW